jgi:hypothetical protein
MNPGLLSPNNWWRMTGVMEPNVLQNQRLKEDVVELSYQPR